MMLPALSTMLPDPSTRPTTAPDEFTTLPSARTEKPPADTPPVDPDPKLPPVTEPAAPEIALPAEPKPPPDTLPTERAMMLPFVPTRLPDPSMLPMIEPAEFATWPFERTV